MRPSDTQMPIKTAAEAFLTLLDEERTVWSFQTFDDDDSRSDKSLSRLLHGTLDQYYDELVRLNHEGAGIFVTINETDGNGRKKHNIVRATALFVDLDGAPLAPVQNAESPPHIIVQSSEGRFHAYWRIKKCSVEEIEPALRVLVQRYGGDPKCIDRSRVLRLPGFYHCKSAPYLVHVIDSSPGECTLADLEISIDLQKGQKIHRSYSSVASVASVSSVGEVIPRYLPREEGQRNRCLFNFAKYLKGVLPEATKDERRWLVTEWHRQALPFISTKEFGVSWGDFERAWKTIHTPYGAILADCIDEAMQGKNELSELGILGYGDLAIFLASLCRVLQRRSGSEPFFISVRIAGDVLGIHFSDAAKLFKALVADDILRLISQGAGMKASRYRYIWDSQ